MASVFITGATGYIGRRVTKKLVERGHTITALVRKGSEHKLPQAAKAIVADPFDPISFQQFIPKNSVFVQLLGVVHPSPAKARQFREIDLRSVKASADAASFSGVSCFVYVSISMEPSKLMKAYQDVRREGENYCVNKKLNCIFIRPWYVIGPGHFWPLFLLPLYGVAELVPYWKKKARAMGLVSITQIVTTLVKAIEQLPGPARIMEIKDIRNAHL